MKTQRLFPTPDSTEPRDEDLQGRDDKGEWKPGPKMVLPYLTAMAIAGSIVGGAMIGLAGAVAWTVFHVLTRGAR
jgi:hypothetical protein